MSQAREARSPATTHPGLITEVIRDTLRRMPLATTYGDEQRDLQPAVKRALEEALLRSFPTISLQTTISVGGKGKPSLRLHGTSFWPDVDVSEGPIPLAAIEVKIIRPPQGASTAIAEAIGQSIIYSVRYPHVFTFVVHYGRSDVRFHDEDDTLTKRLALCNVELIVRGPGDAPPPSA